jgi:hypothetical protein
LESFATDFFEDRAIEMSKIILSEFGLQGNKEGAQSVNPIKEP